MLEADTIEVSISVFNLKTIIFPGVEENMIKNNEAKIFDLLFF